MEKEAIRQLLDMAVKMEYLPEKKAKKIKFSSLLETYLALNKHLTASQSGVLLHLFTEWMSGYLGWHLGYFSEKDFRRSLDSKIEEAKAASTGDENTFHSISRRSQEGAFVGGTNVFRPSQASLLESGKFAQYEILGLLGEGGMGKVYRAKEVSLDREVALKIIKQGEFGQEGEKRFLIEAQALAKLSHPCIVPIYAIGEHEGVYYYTMQLIRGKSLSDIVKEKSLPIKMLVDVLYKISLGVEYAHSQGIVHRDLKPANIMLNEKMDPYILDFGLAKILSTPSKVSVTGVIMGTLAYMSPEQADGKSEMVDHKTDIYALGAILYECITGRPPFQGSDTINLIFQILHHEPIPPRRLMLGIHGELETICLKCLEKQKHRRYRSALDLAQDLKAYREGRPVKAKPASFGYRLWRLMMRNKMATSIIAVMSLLLFFSLSSLVHGLFILKKEKAFAETQRQKALQEKQNALDKKNESIANLVDAYLYLGKYQENLANYIHASLCYARAITLIDQDFKGKGLLSSESSEKETFSRRSLWGSYLRLIPMADFCRPDQDSFPVLGKWSDRYVTFCCLKTRVRLFSLYAGTLRQEMDHATALAFHRTSDLVAVATQQKMVYVWKKGVLVNRLQGHKSVIKKLWFSKDGGYLGSASKEEAFLWDLSQDKMVSSFDLFSAHADFIDVSNGISMIIAKVDGFEMWDVQKRFLHWSDRSNRQTAPEDVRFLPDATSFAVVYPREIEIRQLQDGKRIAQFKSEKEIRDVDFEAYGKKIFIVDGTSSISVWNSLNDELRTLSTGLEAIHRLAVHPSGKWVALHRLGAQEVTVWDIARNIPYKKVAISKNDSLEKEETVDLFFKPDGETLAVLLRGQSLNLLSRADNFLTKWKAGNDVRRLVLEDSGSLVAAIGENEVAIFKKGKNAPVGRIFTGKDIIRQACFLPLSHEIVLGTQEGLLLHYRIDPVESIKRIDAHWGSVVSMHWCEKAKSLLTIGEDCVAKLWEPGDWRESVVKEDLIFSRLNPSNDLLALRSAGERGVSLFDLARKTFVAPEKDRAKWEEAEYHVAHFNTDHVLLRGKDRMSFDLWGLSPLEHKANFLIRRGSSIQAMALSSNGKLVGCVNEDQQVHVWDASKRTLLKIYECVPGPTFDFQFHPTLPLLLRTTEGPWVPVRDALTGEIFTLLQKNLGNCPTSFTSDGEYIFSEGMAQEMSMWELKRCPQMSLMGHENVVSWMAFSSDSSRLASGSYDGTIKIWDREKGAQLLDCGGYSPKNREFMLGADGNWLAFLDENNSLILWNLKERSLLHTGKSAIYTSLAFSPDGRCLGIADQEGLAILDLQNLSWQAMEGGKALTGNIHKIAFSPNGKRIVGISNQNRIAVWDVASKRCVGVRETEDAITEAIAFSPDGLYLANAGNRGIVRVWRTDDLSSVKELMNAKDSIDRLFFDPYGNLVAGSRDGWVRICNLRSETVPLEIDGYEWEGQSLSVLGKNLLAFKDKQKRVQIWDILTGRQLADLDIPGERVESLCGSPDGKYLSIGGNKQKLYIHEVERVHALVDRPSSQLEGTLERETGHQLDRFKLVPIPPRWK